MWDSCRVPTWRWHFSFIIHSLFLHCDTWEKKSQYGIHSDTVYFTVQLLALVHLTRHPHCVRFLFTDWWLTLPQQFGWLVGTLSKCDRCQSHSSLHGHNSGSLTTLEEQSADLFMYSFYNALPLEELGRWDLFLKQPTSRTDLQGAGRERQWSALVLSHNLMTHKMDQYINRWELKWQSHFFFNAVS